MRIVVTGSRTWDDLTTIVDTFMELQEEFGTDMTPGQPPVQLIHGGAQGADALAARCALLMGWDVIEVPAEWDRFGPSAGPKRNIAMLNMHPDLVVAFWDGVSVGTGHCMSAADKRKIPVRVVRSRP